MVACYPHIDGKRYTRDNNYGMEIAIGFEIVINKNVYGKSSSKEQETCEEDDE